MCQLHVRARDSAVVEISPAGCSPQDHGRQVAKECSSMPQMTRERKYRAGAAPDSRGQEQLKFKPRPQGCLRRKPGMAESDGPVVSSRPDSRARLHFPASLAVEVTRRLSIK